MNRRSLLKAAALAGVTACFSTKAQAAAKVRVTLVRWPYT